MSNFEHKMTNETSQILTILKIIRILQEIQKWIICHIHWTSFS